jgi:hypothetical protein
MSGNNTLHVVHREQSEWKIFYYQKREWLYSSFDLGLIW